MDELSKAHIKSLERLANKLYKKNEKLVSELKEKEPMTKITIEVSDDDCKQEPSIMGSVYSKVYKAYKEAKAKEIKVGDWILDSDKNGNDLYQAEEMHLKGGWEHCRKLPQNLQDGLNEFMKEKKEWNHQGDD